MAAYGLITVEIVSVGSTGKHKISVQASDCRFLNGTVNHIRQLIPKAKVRGTKQSPGSTSPNICEIYNLGDKDEEVGWEILRFLCETDWEPSSTDSYMTSLAAGFQRYHFRKKLVPPSRDF